MASIPQKEKRPLTRRMRRYALPFLAGLLLTFFAAGCRPEAERLGDGPGLQRAQPDPAAGGGSADGLHQVDEGGPIF